LVAVFDKPPNLSHGAQKVFKGKLLRRMLENEFFRGFLGVQGRRIDKTSCSRSSVLAGAASRSARVRQACPRQEPRTFEPRPRLTSSPPPLEGAPVAALSTSSTDSPRSPAPVGCV
jgi:hypothetical protein